jgi:salicylate 5-hydroxylase large subunit
VYHQWCYDLKGNLKAVPFRDGVWSGDRLASGLPKDFDFAEHGLRPLRVCPHNGVIFASFDSEAPEFVDFLGPKMRYYFERVFDGRALRFLGRSRQKLACNWKLVFENIKDYHATLLHVFLVTFGLYRADQPSRIEMDEMGRHSVLVSSRGGRIASDGMQGVSSLKPNYVLHDAAIITGRKEFKDEPTVVMQTLFPNLIIQQQTNTLALRQILPKGPRQTELVWDFFGYADDDEEMQRFRLNQSSLMGPAGLVTVDDAEAVEICQRGLEARAKSAAVVEMGGEEIADTDYMVTEAPLRGFYRYYRNIMGSIEP